MKIYNTLSRQKEEFVPLEANKVKMYVCGPTVYNYMHIGNARPYVVFDTLRRYFEYQGYEVNFVQNYTDVDDKIIKKAHEENVPMSEISQRYIKEAETDAQGLNVKKATANPRVTGEMADIIKMVEELIAKGYAYEKNGSVFFDTGSYPEYGKLSRRNLEELESGARIAVDEEKKSPMDFVLWKPKKEGEPGWQSPWGEGRPGWHIECSVMAKKYLGDTIDIHAGGEDLIFPHHENEIAQSEAANGKAFARYWMHNGFINIDNQKMSKSKGNFFTLREIVENYPYDVVRFFLLSGHYRSPINFSEEIVQAAQAGLGRIKTCLSNMLFAIDKSKTETLTEAEKGLLDESKAFEEDFVNSMEDDLNTADAIAAVFDFVRFINSNLNEGSSREFGEKLYTSITKLCGILGISVEKKEQADQDAGFIEMLVAQRTEAKKNRDFQKADALRQELLDMGIVVEDTRQGARWYRSN